MSFFDTNILVDALQEHPAAVREWQKGAPHRISRITWAEILTGARDAGEERALESFLSEFRIVEFTEAVARKAARLRRTHRMKLPDAIIYASAQEVGEDLVTRNTKDFPPGLPGVRVPYKI